ncbi:MAG: RsmB/NOP family class I SAM-dependent RNA methyltransferase [Verrucomicrobia bacterium]|nr:MAG: RsmB/NOP family class I SAM-dependent RNA methyltransferase [Verrucomicrobiota bacterium]
MKMHRILAQAAVSLTKSVFREHQVLDHALAEACEANPKWGKRDRAFLAETVYEVVRWRRALAFVADCEEISALCAAQWTRMGYEIPEWWAHHGCSQDEMRVRENNLNDQPRAIRESIPDWLDEFAFNQLGEAWDAEISALNRRAIVFLRVNRLQATVEEVIAWLASHQVHVEQVLGVENALCLPQGQVLPKSLRHDGRIEIQDAGSQLIAPLLDVSGTMRVIDACAGAGGKTLQIAALMRGRGRIDALDVDAKKLNELRLRAKRAGAAGCIHTHTIGPSTPSIYHDTADRLLIDAPCSGLGTLRRQPDLKWRLKPAMLERIQSLQARLLLDYPAMLKVGGKLVYATCSILPSENRQAIEPLIASGNFSLLEERAISPADDGFDGFYAAVLKRN